MNGITHKQAQRYLRMDLDGLLSEAQQLDLKTHLRACEACRADSESFSRLTTRLQAEFHSRWDLRQDGPSQNVLANIRKKSRRIMMQKRIDFVFNLLGGAATILVLGFLAMSVLLQVQKNPIAPGKNQPNISTAPEQAKVVITFTSQKDGNLEIYSLLSDGSHLTNLTNNPGQDYAPAWSPDSSKIAFTSDRNGNADIFSMLPDGSGLTRLTDDPGDDAFLGWSPDGKQIAYLAGGEHDDLQQITVMDADGSHMTPLTRAAGHYYFQGWSPDGKHILYAEPNLTSNGAYRDLSLHTASTDGTSAQEWYFDNFELLRWEDARHFLGIVRENGSGGWSLYRLNVQGNPVVIASHRDPLAGSFEKTIVVESHGSLQWFALEGGTSGSQATWNFADFCEAPAGVTQQVNLSISPDRQRAVAVVTCKDARWLYLVSADGQEIEKLGSSVLEGKSEILVSWLPDGRHATLLAFQPNGSAASLYLLEIQKMQEDVNIQPVLLTTEAVHPYQSAPPSRIGN